MNLENCSLSFHQNCSVSIDNMCNINFKKNNSKNIILYFIIEIFNIFEHRDNDYISGNSHEELIKIRPELSGAIVEIVIVSLKYMNKSIHRNKHYFDLIYGEQTSMELIEKMSRLLIRETKKFNHYENEYLDNKIDEIKNNRLSIIYTFLLCTENSLIKDVQKLICLIILYEN